MAITPHSGTAAGYPVTAALYEFELRLDDDRVLYRAVVVLPGDVPQLPHGLAEADYTGHQLSLWLRSDHGPWTLMTSWRP